MCFATASAITASNDCGVVPFIELTVSSIRMAFAPVAAAASTSAVRPDPSTVISGPRATICCPPVS